MDEQRTTRSMHIFEDAIERAPAERGAYIAQACGGDAGLRAEVESLLSAAEQAGGFLAGPSGSGPSPALGNGNGYADAAFELGLPASDVEAALAKGSAEVEGSAVGRYRLLEQIGEGGFGAVFLAEQERPVRRRVALKIIKPGMDTKQVVARFEAERQALALMDHPGIARVFDGGTTDAGRAYFVMELVEGPPITGYCDEKKLPVRRRLELFARVCDAVHHAHQKGVIHRDLKPTNVLVAERDGRPVPKVIDFGVAKAVQGRLTEHSLHTEQRQLLGTPEYMSPEQAAMGAAAVDTRSDVYSLGVLLYELLTGATPFDAKDLRSKSVGEIERVLREVEPPAPSERVAAMDAGALSAATAARGAEPAGLPRLLWGELDWVAMRCLEKDPVRRYESAVAVAADVRRHLSGEAVLARPTTARYRVGKFVRRHKAGVAAAAAVAAALVLGVFGTTAGMLRARAAEQQARTDNAAAEREAAGATAAYDFVLDLLGGANPQKVGGGREARVVDVLDLAAGRISERLRNYPEVEIKARRRLAQTYVGLGMYPESDALLRPALELARQVHGPEDVVTLTTAQQLASVLIGGGINVPEGERLARESLAVARRRLGEWHRVTRGFRFKVYEACRAQDRLDEGGQLLREDLALRASFPEDSDRDCTVVVLNHLGQAELAKGRLAEAEALLRETTDARDRHPSPRQDTRWRPEELAAQLAGARDDVEAADAGWAKLLSFARVNLGGGYWNYPVWTEHHAQTLTARRKFGDALQLRREQLDMESRSAKPRPDVVAERTLDVADLLWLAGDRAGCEALRTRATEAGAKPTDTPGWRWRRAALRPLLGDEAEWSSPSLFAHAWALADTLVEGSTGANDLVEDPAAAGFTLSAWCGDVERVAAGGMLGGTLAQCRGVGNLPPGAYRLALELPRRSGPPLRGEAWVPLWPWVVERYELQSPNAALWAEVRANHKAPSRPLAALALGDGWTLYPGAGGQRQRFGLVATAAVELPMGKYRVAATSDDGVRVWVDGRLVIDAWTMRPATTNVADIDLPGGWHDWRVEYFDGWGEFKLWLEVAPTERPPD